MVRKYLDPKADLTFKKVFGDHKNLMVSFLTPPAAARRGQAGGVDRVSAANGRTRQFQGGRAEAVK